MLYKDLSGIMKANSCELILLSFPDAPRVELRLGKSIKAGHIYEGGDVYFDCLVNARPPPIKILWQQNVSIK